jgi:alpha-galactosidase
MVKATRNDYQSTLLKALLLIGLAAGLRAPAFAGDVTIHNQQLTVTVRTADGSYEIQAQGAAYPAVRAIFGAEISNARLKSTDFPAHHISQSDFTNSLGSGSQLTISSTGLAGRPDLICIVRLYSALPYGEIEIEVRNGTGKDLTVQSIRPLEAVGDQPVHLGDSESSDRVLSDSFSEDWPPMVIYDRGKAPQGLHLGVGSELLYNRDSKQGLFFGALNSEKFLTILRLQTKVSESGDPRIASYTIDSTGTTEIQTVDDESGLYKGPAENRVELSLPLAPGGEMNSERMMFAAGNDYHAELEAYGTAVRELHHALVRSPNLMGWWSWTAFYHNITEGDVFSNAQWLAQHLKQYGYNYLHLDEGYQYARGEYTTPDATRFPHGLRGLEHEISNLGLVPAIWVAPFEVTDRTRVYQNHKDWLVHNARGEPIPVGEVEEGIPDRLYVLDATNPAAQEYLRQQFQTLVREWGVRYIKLDFMDTTAIEGYYHRPHTTALEAQRIGLNVIRKAVGENVLLDKDGSPMLNVVGILDEGRVSQDTGHSFNHSKESSPGIFARYYMNRNFFVNDPDAFTVSNQILDEHPHATALKLNEAQVSIALSAVSGGMFEIGDDLPTLGADPDRVALLENPDLLQMVKLGRAAVPLDLLTYRAEDEQPSVLVLKEDRRETMLAVFNWTDQTRSHTFTLDDLQLAGSDTYQLSDSFNKDEAVAFDNGSLHLDDPARSVRLIKIIDASVAPAAPSVEADVPDHAKMGETLTLSAKAADSVPMTDCHWDFGDGITQDGESVTHTYTREGTYTVHMIAEGVDGISAEKTSTVKVSGQVKTSPPSRYAGPGE